MIATHRQSLGAAGRPGRVRSLWQRLEIDAGSRDGLILLILLCVVTTVVGTRSPLLGRAAIGIVGAVILGFATTRSSELAVVGLIGWLVMLGFVRRLLIPFAGWSPSDPLLLVAPLGAVLILFARRGRARTPISLLDGMVLFLLLWTVAEVVNPSTFDVTTNLQGELYWGLPLLWFFVGRVLSLTEHERIQRVILVLTVPVLISGLYQSFVGFLPFELHWLSVGGPGQAIFLPGFKIRPFSTLNSPQEYGVFLAIAITLIWARLLHRPREWRWLLPFLAVTVLALILQSSRGILLLAVFAIGVQAVIRFRSAPVILLAAAAIGGVILFANPYAAGAPAPGVVLPPPPTTASAAASTDASTDEASALLTHEFNGIANPGGSTAPIHADIIQKGFAIGLAHPLGLGSAATTVAAAKSGGLSSSGAQTFLGSEEDFASAAPALGIVGAVTLLLVILVGLSAAVRAHWRSPSLLHLGWLGILVVTVGQWLNGGLYATVPIVLLSLGGVAGVAGARRASRGMRRPADVWAP